MFAQHTMTSNQIAEPASAGLGSWRERALRAVVFMLPIAAVVIVWEAAVRSGVADSTILPAPSAIVARAIELLKLPHPLTSPLVGNIEVSLLRALAAFVAAVLVGVPLGFAFGLSAELYSWARPILSLLLPLPAVAWTPIFLVALGQGNATIISVCFLGAVFPVLFSTIQGVKVTSRHSIWVVRSMGAGPLDIFRRVLIPAVLPSLIAGLKLGMAHSWRTLVAAEMLAALSSGLGYMIFAARSYMDVPTMFVGIICLSVIGMAIEHGIFGPLEAMTVRRWHGANCVRNFR